MISIVTACDFVLLSDQVNCPQRGPSPRAAPRLIGDAEMSTVLIVDAYAAVRKALRRLLETELCSVVCIEAINGLDAIAKTEASCPDLVILDLCMPKMNGFEAAAVLQKTMPQVPLFMFTSHESRDVESEAGSAGIRAVFSKQTDVNALLAEVSDLLKLSPALA